MVSQITSNSISKAAARVFITADSAVRDALSGNKSAGRCLPIQLHVGVVQTRRLTIYALQYLSISVVITKHTHTHSHTHARTHTHAITHTRKHKRTRASHAHRRIQTHAHTRTHKGLCTIIGCR